MAYHICFLLIYNVPQTMFNRILKDTFTDGESQINIVKYIYSLYIYIDVFTYIRNTISLLSSLKI